VDSTELSGDLSGVPTIGPKTRKVISSSEIYCFYFGIHQTAFDGKPLSALGEGTMEAVA